MTYRPGFVTQRDGSALANSNCRMASIAMGLDYQTLGGQTSTGSKMRSYTDDQSGGTDSGDARQAWDRGYDQALTVRDGSTFTDALADLDDGRTVHLDVWHAAVGGPCLSGSGGYGHTIAVLPDHNADGWAVGDPWCTDGWHRVSQAKLQAGAEAWGGQVWGLAAQEADWPSGGPIDPRDALVLLIVARIVRRLVDRNRPGREGRLEPVDPPDTGGAQPIMYTTTKVPTAEGDDVRFINSEGYVDDQGRPTRGLDMVDGDKWTYFDGSPGGSFSSAQRVPLYGRVDAHTGEYAARITTGIPYENDDTKRPTLVLISTSRPYVDLPPVPTGDDLAARQAQYDADALMLLGPRPTD